MERVPLTSYGYAMLQAELTERISIRRPSIIKAIEEARGHGDLKENAEYHAAKEEQGLNEARISDLESKLGRAEVFDPTKLSGKKVTLGATLKLIDVNTDETLNYILVGPDESNLEKGLISTTSPIGRALLGKNEGDEATLNAPSGKRVFEIAKVEYKAIAM
ncbi:MAG: transcription elongation factor GreA [Alphaproteobacteria bacterium]